MRHQLPALLLVLVLAVASVLWTLRLDWFPYADDQPEDVAAVAAGKPGSYAGTTFTVTETRRIPGDSARGEKLEVAPDATLVVVSLDVEPVPGLGVCELAAVAGETHWDTAGFSDSSWSTPDRFESYCDGDATEPYALQVVYIVPAAVADEVDVEVTDPQHLPQVLRLALPPDPA